jgi:hypothetical protein
MATGAVIESVRVFELPCGIWADGDSIGAARAALVRWRSSAEDKLHQVYVEGGFAGATLDCEQREMLVPLPSSPGPMRIEVVAVNRSQADTDLGDELDLDWGQSGRVRIVLLRSQKLPVDSTVKVYSNGGAGEIEYDGCVNDFGVCVWPWRQDKAGFGLSRFGSTDFGWDGAAAVGFGKGSFGKGEFGFDADTFEFVSGPLEAGVYRFGIKVFDAEGNESMVAETGGITVIPAAKPAEQLAISSYDKQTNELVLEVS